MEGSGGEQEGGGAWIPVDVCAAGGKARLEKEKEENIRGEKGSNETCL